MKKMLPFLLLLGCISLTDANATSFGKKLAEKVEKTKQAVKKAVEKTVTVSKEGLLGNRISAALKGQPLNLAVDIVIKALEELNILKSGQEIVVRSKLREILKGGFDNSTTEMMEYFKEGGAFK